jgi:hypothetical protein
MISLDLLRAGDPVEETVGPFVPDPNGNIVEVLPTTSTRLVHLAAAERRRLLATDVAELRAVAADAGSGAISVV